MNSNIIPHHLYVAALSNSVSPAANGHASPKTSANGNGALTGVSRRLARALAAAESGRAARLRLGELLLRRALDSRSNP